MGTGRPKPSWSAKAIHTPSRDFTPILSAKTEENTQVERAGKRPKTEEASETEFNTAAGAGSSQSMTNLPVVTAEEQWSQHGAEWLAFLEKRRPFTFNVMDRSEYTNEDIDVKLTFDQMVLVFEFADWKSMKDAGKLALFQYFDFARSEYTRQYPTLYSTWTTFVSDLRRDWPSLHDFAYLDMKHHALASCLEMVYENPTPAENAELYSRVNAMVENAYIHDTSIYPNFSHSWTQPNFTNSRKMLNQFGSFVRQLGWNTFKSAMLLLDISEACIKTINPVLINLCRLSKEVKRSELPVVSDHPGDSSDKDELYSKILAMTRVKQLVSVFDRFTTLAERRSAIQHELIQLNGGRSQASQLEIKLRKHWLDLESIVKWKSPSVMTAQEDYRKAVLTTGRLDLKISILTDSLKSLMR